MEIRPDPKLLSKHWLSLATISCLIVLVTLVLYYGLPLLKDELDPRLFGVVIWTICGSAILLLWVISVPLIALWVRNLSYRIVEDKVIVHKGILTKVQQNIPFRMITDFRLHRSLYDRWLGIASMQVQTAGQSGSGTGYEAHLAGLLEWRELHERLRRRIEVLQPQEHAAASAPGVAAAGEDSVFPAMLEELRRIRGLLERQTKSD